MQTIYHLVRCGAAAGTTAGAGIIGHAFSEEILGTVYITIMDLTYAHGGLPLSKDTSNHSNFSMMRGKSTGTN